MASDRSSSSKRSSSNKRTSNQRSSSTRQQSSQGQSTSRNTLDVQEALDELMDVDGAIGAAIVDYESGMTLGTVGGRNLDMELAGAGTTEVVRSERNILHDLGLRDGIEDILVSLEHQYHLIRICENHENLFIYLAIDREEGNLGLSRREVDAVDEQLVID